MKRKIFLWVKRITLFGIIPVILILSLVLASAAATFYYTISFIKDQSAYHKKIDLPDSIDVLEKVEIGGIEQGISIRGQNKDAPVLLFLHGGPGSNTIRYSHEFTGPWEEYFTVAVWDQRGCGESYYSTEQIGDTMTVPQMMNDTVEVIDYLRKRFNREKIFVMGHSWGSLLGINMAKLYPEKLYAYIGIGQCVDQAESRRLSYAHALKLMKERNDVDAVKELEALAPYPDNKMPVKEYYECWGTVQEKLSELGINEWHQKTDPVKIQTMMLSFLLRSHTISLREIYRDVFSKDQPSSLPSLKEGVRQINIPEQLGYEYEVPIFFILAENDWQAYYKLALDYHNKIKAPYKEVLLLKNSAHIMYVEEPGRILNFLVNNVLPYADEKAQDKGSSLRSRLLRSN